MRVALVLLGLLCFTILLFPDWVTSTIGAATGNAMVQLDTAILWFSSAMVLLCVFFILGPWGSLRLGRENEQPEFGTFSWLAMLFAAGMGSGLVFWGVAEPLTHFAIPPLAAVDGVTLQAQALAITFFHWGLHAWAIYAIAGFSIAWFCYRHHAAETPSGALETGLRGMIPSHQLGRLGSLADTLAVLAVVFGVAGALANGTILLREGLGKAMGEALPEAAAYAIILLSMALAFLASASTGIKQGIRWLSSANVILALLLMLLVFMTSQQADILRALWDSTWRYLQILPSWSVQPLEIEGSRSWSHGWSITYLLWWIAWAPFVGIFIARISRGRSIRAYFLGVLIVPVVFSMCWFSIMGGGAFAFDARNGGELLQMVQSDYTEPLFAWFSSNNGHSFIPGVNTGTLMAWMACILLFVFLVTSADSAAYVLGMLSSAGNPNPARSKTLLWGGLTVVLAAGLLARDSADVNKTVAIAGAIPYAFLLLLQIVALMRSFIVDVFKTPKLRV